MKSTVKTHYNIKCFVFTVLFAVLFTNYVNNGNHRTWSEIQFVGFLMHRLKYDNGYVVFLHTSLQTHLNLFYYFFQRALAAERRMLDQASREGASKPVLRYADLSSQSYSYS